jgi:hypothetical protein
MKLKLLLITCLLITLILCACDNNADNQKVITDKETIDNVLEEIIIQNEINLSKINNESNETAIFIESTLDQMIEHTLVENDFDSKIIKLTTLYIEDKDWMISLELDDFQDHVYENSPVDLFYYKSKDDYIMTVFGSQIEGVNDIESCQMYYTSGTLKYLEEEHYFQESKYVIGASNITMYESGNSRVTLYDLYFPPLDTEDNVVQRRAHLYSFYDGYCFDFFLSKFNYVEETDGSEFDNIFGSIRIQDIEDRDSFSYTIKPNKDGKVLN